MKTVLPICLIVLSLSASAQDKLDLYGDPLPAGADVRLGTMRFRHVDLNFEHKHPHQISFYDNQTVVSELNGALRFWRADSGELLREVDLGERNVSFAGFSPDRSKIFTMSMQTKPDAPAVSHYRTRIWDVGSGKLISTLTATDGFNYAVFSADGDKFLTVNNNRVGVWDVSSGEMLPSYKLFLKESIQSFAISPHADQQIVFTTNNMIYLWNWVKREKPVVFSAEYQPFKSVVFSPTQPLFATIAPGVRTIQIWDAAERKVVHKIQSTKERPLSLQSLAFTPDGKSLICSHLTDPDPSTYNSSLVVWDVGTWKETQTLDLQNLHPRVLTVSPDSTRVAVRDKGRIAVFDLNSGKRLSGNFVSHQQRLNSLVFSQDSKLVVTAAADATVREWDAESGRQMLELPHSPWASHVTAAISPDGRRIASLSSMHVLHIWDAQTGKELHRLPGHGPHGPFRLVFTPDSQRLMSFGNDLQLRVWELEEGKQLAEHPLQQQLPKHFDFLDDAQFSANGDQLVLRTGKSIHCFHTGTGQHIGEFPGETYRCLSVSPDGTQMLSVSPLETVPSDQPDAGNEREYVLRIRELPSGKVIGVGVGTGRALKGASVFSPDGRLAAVAVEAPEPEIHIWDVYQQQQLLAIKNTPEIMFGKTLAFSADNRKLACGMADYSVLIWDLLEEGLPEALIEKQVQQDEEEGESR